MLAGQAKAAPDAKIDTFIFRGCDAVAVQEQHADRAGSSGMSAQPLWVPDFRGAALNDRPQCQRRARKLIGRPGQRPCTRAVGKDPSELAWQTPKTSTSRALYTADDTADLDFLHDLARACRPTCAGRIRRCTRPSPGRSASTPASRPPRSRTPSTAAISRAVRRACRSRSIWRPTAATTATTCGSAATSAWRASPSTRSTTCASSSTASRWTR